MLGASGAKLIAEMLKVNTPLKSLDISCNNIGVPDGWSYDEDEEVYRHSDGREQDDCPDGVSSGVIALADALVNTPLTTLNIGGNSLGVEGAKAIAGALPR